MKAVVYSKKSSEGKLLFSEIDKPIPKDDEVLIKVHAVSLNAADYRSLKMGLIPRNKIFGADIAGSVESVGKNISLFKSGDKVLGDLSGFGFGGLAEYVTAPERALIAKPSKISFEEAASLPMAALTALQAIRDKGNIQKGDKVLIVGSAGGVGTFAIQLAKYYEAEVTGVCSSKNIEQTLALGADYALDYKKEDFTKTNTHYKLILGIGGNYSILGYKKLLTPDGTYVMIGGSLSQIFKSLVFGKLLSFGSKKMKSLAAKANRKDLIFLSELLESGSIKAVIDRRFSLDRTAEAMKYLSEGHSTGKVIITIEAE